MSNWEDYDDREDVVDERLYGGAAAAVDRRISSRHPLGDPRLVTDFLAQGEAWQPARGEFVAISDMDPGHARATVAFILDHATQIAVTLRCSEYVGANFPANPASFPANPVIVREWLLDTDLVRALLDRGRVPEASVPWASVKAR